MRKGFEWSVSLLGAVVLGIVAAGIFFSVINLSKAAPKDPEKLTLNEACNNNDDCKNNDDGLKCLVIYPGDFIPFCGCLTSEDCKIGRFCGPNNKCK